MSALRCLFFLLPPDVGTAGAGTKADGLDHDSPRRRPIYEPLEDRCLLSAAVWSAASIHSERLTPLQVITVGGTTDTGSTGTTGTTTGTGTGTGTTGTGTGTGTTGTGTGTTGTGSGTGTTGTGSGTGTGTTGTGT